jgi:hypothetical protein
MLTSTLRLSGRAKPKTKSGTGSTGNSEISGRQVQRSACSNTPEAGRQSAASAHILPSSVFLLAKHFLRGGGMDFEKAERQIASMERSLDKAKASALVAEDDPALTELGLIVARKIEKLNTTKKNADFENIFFANIDEDNSEPGRFR